MAHTTNRTTRSLLALAFSAVVLLAACGSSGSAKAGAGATTTSSPVAGATTSTAASGGGGKYSSSATTTVPAAASGVAVNLTTTPLGLTLVDATGHTLYQYKPDPTGQSTCTGPCTKLWPPLTVTGSTVAVGAHLTASLFSTIPGAGGTRIVTISGHALYRFSGDTKAGTTNGQGIGGVWHAAGPLGGTM
jgi:predicted lipoprotein with Yx(FWY)xxD motif